MVDKAKLAEKIDSEGKLLEAIGVSALPRGNSHIPSTVYINGKDYSAQRTVWWHYREQLRMKHGVYKTSQITEALNEHWPGQYAVHVSREDPTQFAYTASTEDGERDKQLRISPGRFLRKYLPLLTDKLIQEIEQLHKVDMDSTYLVARDADTIARIYTTMSGDSGCMRRSGSNYVTGSNTHPSIVYTGPGFGVAYLETPSKVITARCVIWINPEDPKDKRAVRCYGNPTLARKLKADNFEFKSLHGALLAKVPAGKEKDTYYLPYIDGPNGNQSDLAAYVCIHDNYLKIIAADHAKKMPAGTVAYVRSTAGTAVIKHPPQEKPFVSALSGKTFMEIRDNKVEYVDTATGTLKIAAHAEVLAAGLIGGSFYDGNETKVVYAPQGTFIRGYYANEAARRLFGFKALSTVYYPPNSWAERTVQVTGSGEHIKIEDAVRVYGTDVDDVVVRHNAAPLPPKTTHVKATNIAPRSETIYIAKTRPTLKLFGARTYFDTVLHRKKFAVVFGTNEVVRASVVRFANIGGVNINIPRMHSTLAWFESLTDDQIRALFRTIVVLPGREEQAACRWTLDVCRRVAVIEDNTLRVSYDPRFNGLKEYARTHPGEFQTRLFNLICEVLNVR